MDHYLSQVVWGVQETIWGYGIIVQGLNGTNLLNNGTYPRQSRATVQAVCHSFMQSCHRVSA